VEVFDILNEFGIGISNEDMARISLEGLNALRKIIDEFNIKATFFVTKDIVAMFPEEVGILAKEGHEIALHSVIDEQEKEDMIFKELTEQKTYIEKAIGRTIFGHKSHKFLPISLGELKEIGLLYDNSLHPTYVPGRYCNIFKPRSAYKEDGMIEVPVTVTPLFRLPFSCFWFRVLKLHYAKLCTNFTYSRQDYINIYFHNWEFADVSDSSLKWPHKLLIQNLGDRMILEFRHYLQWIIKNRVSIITMLGYVQNQVSK
jgi:hypothetical protein